MESSYVMPKFYLGDSISWFCDSCGEVHHGKVDFAVAGFAYDAPHYEVLTECCDEEKRMYVDEWDVLKEEYVL